MDKDGKMFLIPKSRTEVTTNMEVGGFNWKNNQYQYRKGSCVKAASFFIRKNSNVADASHKP